MRTKSVWEDENGREDLGERAAASGARYSWPGQGVSAHRAATFEAGVDQSPTAPWNQSNDGSAGGLWNVR